MTPTTATHAQLAEAYHAAAPGCAAWLYDLGGCFEPAGCHARLVPVRYGYCPACRVGLEFRAGVLTTYAVDPAKLKIRED